VLSAIRLGAARIALCNRTPQRAVRLARRFIHVLLAHGLARGAIEAWGLDSLNDRDLMAGAAIVINATPMGLKTDGFAEMAYDAAAPDCIFHDMIYAREPTPFLAPALARGLRSLDGAGMLANQGVLAFELFNGAPPPAGVMRGALMAALGRADLPVTRPQ
jgi:shikimate dehydrogenase